MAVTELAEVTGCDVERSLRWAIRQARFGRFGDRGCGSAADVDHELAGEIWVGEPGGDGPGGDGAFAEALTGHQGADLLVDVAAFEVEDGLGIFPFHPRIEVGQGGHGTGDHEVETARKTFRAGVDDLHVVKAEHIRNLSGDDCFLADRVAEGEPHVREHHSERDAGKAATGAEVQNP